MKNSIIAIIALVFSVQLAQADSGYGTRYFPGMEEFPKVRPVEHKKELAPDFKPKNLLHDANKISKITLTLITEDDPEGENLSWEMALPFRYVFLSRIASMEKLSPTVKIPADDLWGRSYKHLKINFERTDGKQLPSYFLFKNKLKVKDITYVDTTNEIETWTFSTVNNYRQLLHVNRALNIDNFKRCKEVGNLTHETDPEQCIFPDGTTFLNVNTKVTPETERTFNFDDCFKNKNPLIEGYPRRCIAPGGHIYTEQPKLKN